jgi:small GTP-binding protein
LTRRLNILVTGPYGAGKTQFIKTISEIPVVSTERTITDWLESHEKSLTTVAMDYGRLTIGKDVLHLRGTPGQERFHFMRELLAREVHGFVLLVDSTNPAHMAQAVELMEALDHLRGLPHVVAANKQDLQNAVGLDEVRTGLQLEESDLVLPCISTRKSSVRQVLIQLLDRIS